MILFNNEFMNYKAKRIDNGEWVVGFYSRVTKNFEPRNIHYVTTYTDLSKHETILTETFEINPYTICIPSGKTDINSQMIWTGDIIDFFGMKGVVTFTEGTFGLGFEDYINWETIEKNIPIITGHNNSLCGCFNDYFISFWEIENIFDDLYNYEVLGNVYDSPELTNKEEEYDKE